MLIGTRQILQLPKTQSDKGCCIMPGEKLRLRFKTENCDIPVERWLRFLGETGLFWKWRQESGIPIYVYQSIEDALDTINACNEKYALKLCGAGETYPRNAYIKVLRQDILPGRKYKFEVFAQAAGLKLDDQGEVTVEIGIYLQREGRHENDAFDLPDLIEAINLPEGSYGWKSFRSDFVMPEDAVLLLIRIGVRGFHGTVRIGTPNLHPEGDDSRIPPLCPPNSFRLSYNWLGENLSRKEWPEFEITLDDKPLFRGAVFNPIYRKPDFELALPDLAAGEHDLEIKLLADYETVPPFFLRGLELLESSARNFEILAFPEYVIVDKRFPVFIRTFQNNVSLQILSDGSIIPESPQITFADAQFAVLHFHAAKSGAGGKMSISDDNRKEMVEIKQIVEKSDDGILLSTGDAVFISQTPDAFMHYLQWYCKNRIGNAMCFRPVYRWSGSRELNSDAWRTIKSFLENLHIFYHLMVDGRELPGKNANPPDALLEGPFYRGRQAHENDGAFCYWGNVIWTKQPLPEPFAEILARSIDPGGIYPAVRPPRTGDKAYWFFDPESAGDMREAAEIFVANLKKAQAGSTRHTGPSTLFRYFYQAGYEMLGAEQMYGPEEIILSALRGASRAYAKKRFGAHLAVQWSSSPHNTPEHAARYFLSLATCYLQGASEINMEEGLWRMEADYVDYDRFSENCLHHLEVHTRFRQFIESHQRRGKIHVPIGIVQGRFDGWRCFSRGNVWMREGDEWSFGPPEESFDLLNTFYPRSRLEDIYRRPCPIAPQGWYSGTPYGAVDIFPIEAPSSVMETYKVIAFLGWNTFATGDFKKLLDFVKGGGTLILARPHLSVNVKRKLSSVLKHNRELDELLGQDYEKASGIIRRKVGKGKVTYFAGDLYPAAKEIRRAYENELVASALEVERIERKKGWMRGGLDVNFTTYDWDDGHTRTIYALNIDWWSGKPSSDAKLLLGEREFKIAAGAGQIETITIADGIAVMPQDSSIDVMKVKAVKDGGEITLQSASGGLVKVFADSSGKIISLETKPGVQTLNFKTKDDF